MKQLSAVVLAGLLASCSNITPSPTAAIEAADKNMSQIEYPITKKGDVVDTYSGVQVADPYRWLEDDLSDETGAWVKAQNKVTFDYLEQIPYRDKLKSRLAKLWNYTRYSAPFKEGQYSYYYKNDGVQNHSVIYRQKDGGPTEVFLDPNTFSQDGTTSLSTLSFSKDGSIAAYSISEGGSDWRKVIIIDAQTKLVLEAPLVDVKFSGIEWQGNEGFYYSSYDKPKGSELSAKTDQHKLYYHKMGQPQSKDQLIFGGTQQQKRRYVWAAVTDGEKYLLISGAVSTSGSNLYIKDLTKPNSPIVTILDHTDSDTNFIDSVGNKLYFSTNLNAPNKKVVIIDAQNPAVENWQELIAQTEHTLSVSSGGGSLFAEYMVDAMSKVVQYDYQGNEIRAIDLPGIGSAGTIQGKRDEQTLYYSFTNYKTPSSTYALNVKTGDSTVFRQSDAQFDGDNYESKQVFYSSKDGTKVPMIITYKKGLELNGKNPTILYGYGGFNVSLTPSFSVSTAVWLEQGGIYAVPNIRGGGEYGKNWHDAGTQLKKQNVFDDFISAAQYLIDSKYTSSDYLAIQGGSNGGLLVGAVMTQRPDLVRVALPAVGVLDMLRYHKFTSGAGWAYDYGTADQNQEMFAYLRAYSPVHNVKEGVSYPATMVTTGDHDDRVVPAHSFKFVAELQKNQAGQLPTLIRIETNGGHGAGTPASKKIEAYADVFSFTLFNMGIRKLR